MILLLIVTITLIVLGVYLVLLIARYLTSDNTPALKLPPQVSPQPSSTSVTQIPVHSGRQISIPILLYHYIGDNPNPADGARDALSISPHKFDEQMEYLSKSGFTPITLDTMYAGLTGQVPLPSKAIVITFDDGYVDLYLNAWPILRKYGFRAVAFIPTGLVGTKYYASWDQLTQMQDGGLLSFQSHGVSHNDLVGMSAEQLKTELSTSKQTLEAKFGIPVNFIAYPYGISNGVVWDKAKQVGFLGGLGTWPSTVVSEGVIYNMPRLKISGELSLEQFAQKI